jgi:hypothetical protein
MTNQTNLVDAKGRPIKNNSIPVVNYGEFTLPVRILRKEDTVQASASVSPGDVIQEMRAAYIEMVDRFTLMASGLAVMAKQSPGGELDKYLSSIGLVLTDLNGKKLYEPNPEYRPVPPQAQAQPENQESVSAE